MHIDICVCTFRRPSIGAAMRSLSRQIAPAGVSLGLIIADNDETPSARETVETLARELSIPVTYLHAPARNISIARNACLDAAKGDWAAFFDDDEIAPADWIGKLYKTAMDDDLDAVFGPAIAQYSDDTPDWIRQKDYHSNWPERRGRDVQTGHTCNALIRLGADQIRGQRFLLEKGKTGGEDTEFFFRIWRAGARLGIAEDAVVYEPVDPGRLNFNWIMSRKYRSGISYGRHSLNTHSLPTRCGLFLKAGAKCLFSLAMGLVTVWSPVRRNYWVLRAGFHAGACSSVFRVKERELYGTA